MKKQFKKLVSLVVFTLLAVNMLVPMSAFAETKITVGDLYAMDFSADGDDADTAPDARAGYMKKHGNYMYVLRENLGLEVYNIEDLSEPTLVYGPTDDADLGGSTMSGGAGGMIEHDGHIYCAYQATESDQVALIKRFDISNPAMPVLSGKFHVPTGGKGKAGYSSMLVFGNYLLAGAEGRSAEWNISNASAATSIVSSGKYYSNSSYSAMATDGTFVYIADGNSLYAVNPAEAPISNWNGNFSDGFGVSSKFYTIATVANAGFTGLNNELAVKDGYLYALDYTNNKIYRFDISGTISDSMSYETVYAGTKVSQYALSDNYLFLEDVVSSKSHLKVIDTTTLEEVVDKTISKSGINIKMEYDDGLLYMVSYANVYMIPMSYETLTLGLEGETLSINARSAFTTESTNLRAIAAKGNYVYGADRFGDLALYDVTNPATPAKVTVTEPLFEDSTMQVSPDGDRPLVISGNYLYCHFINGSTYSSSIIRKFDISVPNDPKYVCSYKVLYSDDEGATTSGMTQTVGTLAAFNGKLYVTCYNATYLFVFDDSYTTVNDNATADVFAKNYTDTRVLVGEPSADFKYYNGLIYLCGVKSGSSRLQVYRAETLQQVVTVNDYNGYIGTYGIEIDAENGYLYMMRSDGLKVVDINGDVGTIRERLVSNQYINSVADELGTVPRQLILKGDYLYAATTNSITAHDLLIYDVSKPAAPKKLESILSSAAYGLTVDDRNNAYVITSRSQFTPVTFAKTASVDETATEVYGDSVTFKGEAEGSESVSLTIRGEEYAAPVVNGVWVFTYPITVGGEFDVTATLGDITLNKTYNAKDSLECECTYTDNEVTVTIKSNTAKNADITVIIVGYSENDNVYKLEACDIAESKLYGGTTKEFKPSPLTGTYDRVVTYVWEAGMIPVCNAFIK